MKYLEYPVAYLEDTDFDTKGNLVNPQALKHTVAVIMAQSSWCPHCTMAKAAFQEFANKYSNKYFIATIQADGDRPSEKALGQRVSKIIPGLRGFPEYALFKNGKFVSSNIKGRGVSDLEAFVEM